MSEVLAITIRLGQPCDIFFSGAFKTYQLQFPEFFVLSKITSAQAFNLIRLPTEIVAVHPDNASTPAPWGDGFLSLKDDETKRSIVKGVKNR